MKLLYVTVSLPFGEAETFTIPEIETLLSRGHEVKIVPVAPSRGPLHHASVAALLPCAVKAPVIDAAMVGAAVSSLVTHPRQALRILRTLLRSRTPKIALKNLAVYPKGAWLARLATQWQADHIHAHWASVPATVAMIASELSGIPFSFTAHRWDIAENNLLADKTAQARFVRFIADDGLSTARAMGIAGLDRKATVIHMGVKLPSGATDKPIANDVAVLLCPAFLHPRKGHTYLLQAMRTLIDDGVACRLIVAGDGPSTAMLADEVNQLGLEGHVTFRGYVAHADLLQMYQREEVDIVVLPSLHEGIPVALMEAMAHGIPVVATRVGGVPELLSSGGGVMVAPADASALAGAIGALLRNPDDARAMGAVGRRSVLAGFSSDAVCARLEAHFIGPVGGPALAVSKDAA